VKRKLVIFVGSFLFLLVLLMIVLKKEVEEQKLKKALPKEMDSDQSLFISEDFQRPLHQDFTLPPRKEKSQPSKSNQVSLNKAQKMFPQTDVVTVHNVLESILEEKWIDYSLIDLKDKIEKQFGLSLEDSLDPQFGSERIHVYSVDHPKPGVNKILLGGDKDSEDLKGLRFFKVEMEPVDDLQEYLTSFFGNQIIEKEPDRYDPEHGVSLWYIHDEKMILWIHDARKHPTDPKNLISFTYEHAEE
jgi:hypothetical protein